jgi:hypothetical protein
MSLQLCYSASEGPFPRRSTEVLTPARWLAGHSIVLHFVVGEAWRIHCSGVRHAS